MLYLKKKNIDALRKIDHKNVYTRALSIYVHISIAPTLQIQTIE